MYFPSTFIPYDMLRAIFLKQLKIAQRCEQSILVCFIHGYMCKRVSIACGNLSQIVEGYVEFITLKKLEPISRRVSTKKCISIILQSSYNMKYPARYILIIYFDKSIVLFRNPNNIDILLIKGVPKYIIEVV